jgi:Rieske Fe-S protein
MAAASGTAVIRHESCWSRIAMSHEATTTHCALDCALGDAIGRRRFLSRAATAAAVAALAACGIASDVTAPTTLPETTLTLSDYPTLATVGGVATLSISGSPVAVVRESATSFVALSRVCTHQGATVNRSGSGWRCPRHGATFTLDGTWAGGQRTSSLREYPTVYDEAAGTVTIG